MRMGIELVLFDLDDTLLRTSDLEQFRGRENLNNTTVIYTSGLTTACMGRADRIHYPADILRAIQGSGRKIGVFTRSPRHYAQTLLANCYPGIVWNVVIGFEDVNHTKPEPEGIWRAMHACANQDVQTVAMVGDDKGDIQAAYNAGCWAFLHCGNWPNPKISENYYTLERVPDAILSGPTELLQRIEQPHTWLPELERAGFQLIEPPGLEPRFDSFKHWLPRELGNGGAWVSVMGRMFAEYEALRYRAAWHALTRSIHENKNAVVFPDAWISALRLYLEQSWSVTHGRPTLVTIVPFKPGRVPRMESLLAQLAQSHQAIPIAGAVIEFDGAVLAYRDGVRSHHGEHLDRVERYTNVRDHLFVAKPHTVADKHIVVIDDVVTSGASLIYSDLYLRAADARNVNCVALAKAIGVG